MGIGLAIFHRGIGRKEGSARTIAGGLWFAKLADTAQFKLKSQKRVGDEMFLVFQRVADSRQ